MKLESRETIHAGMNFILAPMPALTRQSFLAFQGRLEELDVNITNAEYGDNELVIVRKDPLPLTIKVSIVGPQIGQLLILVPQPGVNRSVDVVGAEARDIAKAFSSIWGNHQQQILSCDADIRDLYETESEHAFMEIWEGRLHQNPDTLKYFARPVLGGGLRFVLPAQEDKPMAEVKIESFLQDTNKLFLEAHLTWQKAQVAGAELDPEKYLCEVDDFIQKEVVNFLLEREE